MRRANPQAGFALVATLVMMALIVTVVVAYLANTGTDRSTSASYSNRLRAKMIADSGLAAATNLLYENTRYGNYITAMPAPTAAPAPTPIRTELYRPVNPANPGGAADYLRLGNAIGEVLASRVGSSVATSQTDLRPEATPLPIPAFGDPWGLPDPPFTSAESYNFNQVVRIAASENGRLVHPEGQPAFGQWVRIRNSTGELIGRYAFFIEDESMKLNVDTTGNDLGSPHLRINDLTPVPASTPASQIQEVDPTALLPAADRANANSALTSLGAPGSRLPSKATTALLNAWNTNAPESYSHLITTLSRDDNTTARGWKRLDLNKLVSDAEASGTNAAKAQAATRIADWIQDAWTGPTAVADLQQDADGRSYQLFNDRRLRLQIAANIVDYIDSDNVPTDLGGILPIGFPAAVPVIGIEKIPYLGHIFVIYEASGSTGTTATVRMKLRFTFVNLYDSNLDLQEFVKRITVKGVPAVYKNNASVFNKSAQTFSIPVTSLQPLHPSGFTIPPAALDGNVVNEAGSGARSFDSNWLIPGETVTFTGSQTQLPEFRNLGTQLEVTVYGADAANNEVRLDVTASQSADGQTGYQRGAGSNSIGNFLGTSTAPRSTAAIYEQKRNPGTGNQHFGDPRFRPPILNDRWRRMTLTDPQAVSERVNLMDNGPTTYPNPRAYGVDWTDRHSNRPLAFLRNGRMLNVGELGNVSFAEYPWRTAYLQHQERPPVTGDTTTHDEISTRRRSALDYVLADLFRAGTNEQRFGAININTYQLSAPSPTAAQMGPLQALFLGLPLGPTASQIFLSDTGTAPAASRLSAGVNVLVSTATRFVSGSPSGTDMKDYRVFSVTNKRNRMQGQEATPDDSPSRPYFQIGDLAPTLSRLMSASEASNVSAQSSVTRVVYSALRDTPTTVGQTTPNYTQDMKVEQAFREVSNAITTRGNVFRVLYIGQTIKDQRSATGQLGEVEGASEVVAEYLGEAYIQRDAIFGDDPSNDDIQRTTDSNFRIISNRAVLE